MGQAEQKYCGFVVQLIPKSSILPKNCASLTTFLAFHCSAGLAAHKGTHIYLLVQESVSVSQGEGNLQSLSRRTDFGADLDVVAKGGGNSGKTMPRRTHFT